MDLLKVVDIQEAEQVLFDCLKDFIPQKEKIHVTEALGTIVAGDIVSEEDIPSFRRSTVDGYAVVATDVAAAGDSVPVILDVLGSVNMGEEAGVAVSPGKCVYVPTGGAVPEGADAMVMIEYTDKIGGSKIAVSQSVAAGTNVIKVGEDVTCGTLIIQKGTRVRPQTIGTLCAAGHEKIQVYLPLKIAVISTGDELVPVGATPRGGQMRDVNTAAISAQAQKDGFQVVFRGVIPDDKERILQTVLELKEKADIICISGGSSKGEKDYTAEIINIAGDPGTIVHGVAVKPGKPTIIGYDKASKTIMAGLPGHPVSAFIIFQLLFGSLGRKYTGSPLPKPYYAQISRNLGGSPGRTTCVPVRLIHTEESYLAEPVFGKSGLISTLDRADGYVVIHKNKEGLLAGETVAVHMI
ncbi:MAG: gephyrin-like molybdotransferase Glp [Anaerovoracaceae bacterium]|jgi:molybdopterin molybdotransferase